MLWQALGHIMMPFKGLRGESTLPTKLESSVCTLCEKLVTDSDSLETQLIATVHYLATRLNLEEQVNILFLDF